jgi:hypothetical protein
MARVREILLPWDQQPQESVGPNPTWGIGALVSPHLPEAVSGAYPTVAGAFTVGAGTQGISAKAPATQIPGGVWVDFNPVTISGDFSLVVYSTPSSDSGGTSLPTQGWGASGALAGSGLSIGSGTIFSTLDGNSATLSHSGGPMVVVAVRRGNIHHLYAQGQTTSAVTGTRTGSITGVTFGRDRNVSNNLRDTQTYYAAVIPRALLVAEINELQANPWQLFAPQTIPVPVSAGGATTHATSGALAAAGATLAGSAAHIAKHATSGALAGSGAAVAGSSARTRAHPTSGALAGGGATLAGSANHVVPGGTHDTSGALTGAGAAVSGSAAHIAKHATSGALAGSGATLAGSAARVAAAVTHATSGALVGDGAVVTGLATGPNVSFGGGSWFPNVSKRTRKDDDELTQEVVEAVAAAPKARQKITLANLIGKTAAAQVSREELDKAVAVVRRKKRRQDDELMMMM